MNTTLLYNIRIWILAVLLCGLLAGASPLYGNDATSTYKTENIAPNRFDKEAWSNKTKGLNYTEKPKKKEDTNNNSNIDFPDIDGPDIDIPAGSFEVFSKVVLFGLLFLILGFVVFRVVSTSALTKNKSIKQVSYTIEDIEENLHESDLKRFLREALETKNYRLAVRVYFLAIMKELSMRGDIVWQKDKTNTHYLMEMRRHPKIHEFRRVTRMFDYAWYSDVDFQKANYDQVEPEFRNLLNSVQK